jgi:hypothetical protein
MNLKVPPLVAFLAAHGALYGGTYAEIIAHRHGYSDAEAFLQARLAEWKEKGAESAKLPTPRST